MSEKNPFSKYKILISKQYRSKERENSLDIKNLVKRSNISNFFEQGKKHYRELSKFSQNNDTQASINQQNKRVHVNLYDSNKSAKYSKSSIKMNSTENKTLNAYSASKVPIKKDMWLKNDRESKAKYANQPKTERAYCQNPELINEITVPNRNGVNKFQKYQNYCPSSKKQEVRINNFSEANSDWGNF